MLRMLGSRLSIVLIVAGLLAACGQPAAGTAAAPTAARSATVAEIVNEVQARPSAAAAFAVVASGFVLDVGGQLKTGIASQARVDFADGSILRVAENSYFTLDDSSQSDGDWLTRLTLEAGKVWVSLTGGAMEVVTPVGVASVRGSFAVFEYDPGDPADPKDDVLVVGCIEGSCGAHVGTGDEQLGNLEQVTLTNGGEHVVRIVLTHQAVQEFIEQNPEVGQAIAATLTAAPPPTDTPPPTHTDTPAAAATNAPGATDTPVATATGTSTPPTTTLTPTRTLVRLTATETPTPTETGTITPTATCIPGHVFDFNQQRCVQPSATPTNTPVPPTATFTPLPPTATFTPIPPTFTPSDTPTPDPGANFGLMIQGVSLNGGGSTVTVPGGSPVTISVNYQIWNAYGCPTCITQIVVGLDTAPQFCAYDGIPGTYPGLTSGGSGTITAPTVSGTYQVTYKHDLQFFCGDAMTFFTGGPSIGTIVVP